MQYTKSAGDLAQNEHLPRQDVPHLVIFSFFLLICKFKENARGLPSEHQLGSMQKMGIHP